MSSEQVETSDLDLLVELEKLIGIVKYVALQNYLSDRTGQRVDLVLKSVLKPQAGERILHEMYAFEGAGQSRLP